jgi:hypothetical protein
LCRDSGRMLFTGYDVGFEVASQPLVEVCHVRVSIGYTFSAGR